MTPPVIAFIGGGNMAGAIVGGLVGSLARTGRAGDSIIVVEPAPAQRERLHSGFGVRTFAAADPALAEAGIVVWAVKPQSFAEAAAPCAPHVRRALQLSVMAGVRCAAIARITGADRIVRTMPNTPALIGRGMTGLYALASVDAAARAEVESVLAPTGDLLWVDREDDLDAVTALSGSGPAYVFYLVEAMMEAAVQMGLTAAQGRQLALATFGGATALAQASTDSPTTLRERVTSKGGTTHAAIESLEADRVKAAFLRALVAAQKRSRELGDELDR